MIAVISDIHANLTAFEAVLADIDSHDVERIISLGDVVGYGPDPVACLNIVRERVGTSICGNHDVAALNQAFGFNKYAKMAIDWTRDLIRPKWYSGHEAAERWSFLENLPDRHREGGVLFVHASPRDPITEYIEESDTVDMGFGPSDKIVQIIDMIEKLCFVGHTHKAGIITDDYRYLRIRDLPEQTFELKEGHKALCNIGSVGQPRDGDPRASYVLWDGDSRMTYRRVDYDIQKTIDKMRAVEALHERLGQRLLTGT